MNLYQKEKKNPQLLYNIILRVITTIEIKNIWNHKVNVIVHTSWSVKLLFIFFRSFTAVITRDLPRVHCESINVRAQISPPSQVSLSWLKEQGKFGRVGGFSFSVDEDTEPGAHFSDRTRMNGRCTEIWHWGNYFSHINVTNLLPLLGVKVFEAPPSMIYSTFGRYGKTRGQVKGFSLIVKNILNNQNLYIRVLILLYFLILFFNNATFLFL